MAAGTAVSERKVILYITDSVDLVQGEDTAYVGVRATQVPKLNASPAFPEQTLVNKLAWGLLRSKEQGW